MRLHELSQSEAAAALSDLSVPWDTRRDPHQPARSNQHPTETSLHGANLMLPQHVAQPQRPAPGQTSSSSIPSTGPANLPLHTALTSATPGTQASFEHHHQPIAGPSNSASGTSATPAKRPADQPETAAGKKSSSSNGSKKQRKTTYVSRACAGCRRRKTRCDGGMPRCATCTLYKEDCVYDSGQDGRKPASKEYVQSLQERIRSLEAALEEARRQNGAEGQDASLGEPASTPSTAVTDTAEGLPPSTQHRGAGGRFKVLRRNHVFAYGPTSSYMHLADHPETSADEVARYDDTMPEDDEALFAKHNSASIADHSAWSQWLPEGVPKDLHDDLLNYFFAYVNPFTLFVDEARFYRDFGECSNKGGMWCTTAFYSPILHNVLCAMGSKYSQDPRIQSQHFQLDHQGKPISPVTQRDQGLKFAEKAATYLEKEWNAPVLSTVIGCMLLGTFHQVSAQPTLGWVYEGIGVRLANVLGLHMDSTELAARGMISPELKRARDYCWATVAIQDKLWSYTHGRLPSIRSNDIENVDPPAISASMDAAPWQSYPRGMQLPGLRSTILHHTARLTGLAERIHAINYSVKPLAPAQHHLARSKIRVELMEWHASLPANCSIGPNASRSLPVHLLNLNIAGWYMIILLYRNDFRPASETGKNEADQAEESPADICLSASHKIVTLLKIWRKQHGLRIAAPSLSNITFCVGTIFILAAANEETPNASRMEDIDLSISMLKEIGGSSTFASLSADALQQMKRDWLRTNDAAVSAASPAFSSGGHALVSTPSQSAEPGAVKLSELSNPESELSKMLTAMGWTPPGGAAGAESATNALPERLLHPTEAHSPVTLPVPGAAAGMAPAGQPIMSTLNPADLALSLHPSFFNFNYATAGIDDQFASLFPQHFGGM